MFSSAMICGGIIISMEHKPPPSQSKQMLNILFHRVNLKKGSHGMEVDQIGLVISITAAIMFMIRLKQCREAF